MATQSEPLFHLTRTLGLTTSLFLSGYAFSASNLSIPAISLSPLPLRIKQWSIIYSNGKLVSPPTAAVSLLLWSYSAYTSYNLSKGRDDDWKFYAAAGLLSFAVLPWTLAAMMGCNVELMRRAEGLEKVLTESSEVLIKRWGNLNMVRVVLPMVGAWVGLYAALK